MEENILQRNIERRGDRFEEHEREPDHRVHLPKIEVFRKDESFKFEPLRKILKPPVSQARILRVEPIRNKLEQKIFRPEIIKSKISRLAPYDVNNPEFKKKMRSQLP